MNANVQQSGFITPGHIAQWVTTGVVEDGGALPAAARVLASGRSYNFNTTLDQPIAVPRRVTAFQLTGIIVTKASIAPSAAVGGFYPQASKGGVPIVLASQTYATLAPTNFIMSLPLTSFGQNSRFSSNNLNAISGLLNIWFSLTTPQGAACTADIYIIGIDLS